MRKLASIQRVLDVRPIAGADLIEAVDVLGWTVVTQKSNGFKVGDLVIYFEVDSFLNAEDPRYASFEERFINWNGKRGMRLKTIKLRKQISQGLILPVDEFPELMEQTRSNELVFMLPEGFDVTNILKIEKWEPAEEGGSMGGAQGKKTAGAKQFPSFIRKTDQERVQNYINELPKHKNETFEVSIKLDGSSMTIFHVGKSSPVYAEILKDQEIRALRNASWWGKLVYKVKKVAGLVKQPDSVQGVCSRNIQLAPDDDSHFSAYARVFKLLDTLKEYGLNIAVQGELIGPSIQENYEQVNGLEFYVFDVFDIDTQKYLKPREARAIAEGLRIKYVPVLAEAQLTLAYEGEARGLVDGILASAEGPGMNKGVKREGLVFKSNESDFSFKAISNSYLLKKEGKA